MGVICVKKALIIIALVSVVLISVIKIINYTKLETNNSLTEQQQQMLAVEFDLEEVSNKIETVGYVTDSLRIEVNGFTSIEELLDNLNFKSENDYNAILKRKNDFSYNYTNISGDRINTICFDSTEYLNLNTTCIIYIYKYNTSYGFIAEKSFVDNSDIFDLFK